jgi:hypothetical protein
MESFWQDVLFYVICGWLAWVLLNDSSGGGKRRRAPSAA